jgi:hypothetical protein
MPGKHRRNGGRHRSGTTVDRSKTFGSKGRHRTGYSLARTLANIRGQWGV